MTDESTKIIGEILRLLKETGDKIRVYQESNNRLRGENVCIVFHGHSIAINIFETKVALAGYCLTMNPKYTETWFEEFYISSPEFFKEVFTTILKKTEKQQKIRLRLGQDHKEI